MERNKYIKPTTTFLTYEDICEGETMVVSIRESTDDINDVGAKRFDDDFDFKFESDFDKMMWEEQ